MSTRTTLCSLDPAKYGWTACGGVSSILEPHEMARRQEAKDRYIQNQKEDLGLARRTAYAARKDTQTNSVKIADINSEYEKIQKESTSKYYTITDPSAELKPAAAAAGTEVKEDEAALSLLPLANNDTKKEKLKEIAIHATTSATPNGDDDKDGGNNKNNLDIYTYHRGRTGQEPRNIHGELLCDTDPVDTNFNWNPPKTFVCKVTVKFPLGDLNEDEYVDSDLDDDEDKKDGNVDGGGGGGGGGEGDKSTSASGGELNLDDFEIMGSSSFKESAIEAAARASRSRLSRGSQQQIWDQKQNDQSSNLASAAEDSLPHFVETVQWDLANPKTPSPEEYAAKVATEWGLTFPQTMDLKDSIEKQLEAFCNSQNKFYAPIAVVDPYGSERPSAHYGPPETHCGPVLSTGGSARPTIRRVGSTMSGASRKSRDRPAGQVKPNPRGGIHVVPQEQVEKPNKKGDAYCAEILNRIKQHSKNTVAECVSEGKATLKVVKNDVCHVCHNRKECGLTFHCGRHSFCEYHVATRLSFLVGDYDSKNPTCLPIDYCPVCTLQCTCAKCSRRLSDVAKKMKEECIVQNVGVEEVVMKNLYELCSAKNLAKGSLVPTKPPARSSGNMKKKGTKRGRSLDTEEAGGYKPRLSISRSKSLDMDDQPPQTKKKKVSYESKPVKKLLPTEFPQEMFEGRDLDPSTQEDMNGIYTPDGHFPAEGDDVTTPVTEGDQYQKRILIPVDGNFFLCAVCGLEVDERVCCKMCPRSYHKKCLEKSQLAASASSDTAVKTSEKKMACKRCEDDIQVYPDEDINAGVNNIPNDEKEKVQNAYKKYEEEKGFTFNSLILCELLQILSKLSIYDYGELFSVPVDTNMLTDYLKTIRTPMDYGTIISNLEKGEYSPSSDEKDGEMDAMEEIVLYALKDILQVHHNCLMYNPKGGMYHRAGEVQARKWNAYYSKYIVDRISPSVLAGLAKFEKSCEIERQSVCRPRQFNAKTGLNGSSRAVAVFDPDTKKIVKMYTSKATARAACLLLHNSGYESGWELKNSNAKARIDGAKDPEKTLFGYQWIPIDELKAGDFKLKKKEEGEGAVKPMLSKDVVILKEDTLTKKVEGFVSQEEAFADWSKEIESSLKINVDGNLSDFIKQYLDGDKTVNGMSYRRVESEKNDESSGKVVEGEEMGKSKEN